MFVNNTLCVYPWFVDRRSNAMNLIAEFREEAGITQAALHRKLNWKQSRLANYESGARPLKLDDARKIVGKLHLT